ncbi:hypothetical protein FPQ18DRAFT_332837 [Pyronema domesticum]|uniref:Similar to Meiotically up-regulated gene 157 protein acc. no. Q10449 n=1 Tax=Pyronema omphalodes (strain CBS 100304) TaxID=1076935 RepID=U4KVW2_PYROM|nr:hypothetical protein FPQ18DRAFT_332837 [Pyronema domesticum]CCX05783.1 Similar to Meiotically up-regulated gene 157 protein; acc. no. Q10449 [Pyronema omphalodes CBS 100304]
MHFPMLLLSAALLTTASAYTDRKPSLHSRAACPDYKDYSTRRHGPYSTGRYSLPFQRPSTECRLFTSPAVEAKIKQITSQLADPDLARLFENTFPNTLDTTVRWHQTATPAEASQSFIVTGDINAQWLRDSTNQLAQYQSLAPKDPALKTLLLGAINTQADYVLESPYCNAFQPPRSSGLAPTSNGQNDRVHPTYDPNLVFECKYEIDSLASFLSLGNQYYAATGDGSFMTAKWVEAVQTVMQVIEEQSTGTFAPGGRPADMTYTFSRQTDIGTETLNLGGIGNPLASNTSLIRSAFRPSDDATIMQFFIPGNAFMSVELQRTADILSKHSKDPKNKELAKTMAQKSKDIKKAIYKYGVTTHPEFGKVFAYEVDGYGSHVMMDDANLPSLLALPLLGFIEQDDPLYQSTRKMVLSPKANPYYLPGASFSGIGGPHIGIKNAWPISRLVQAMTSDDDDEIVESVEMVLKTAAELGLIHESVEVQQGKEFTRSWFAWANSVFAHTILDLVERKPGLVIGPKARLNGKQAKLG